MKDLFPPTESPEWLTKITSLYHIEPIDELREQMKKRVKEQMRKTKICDVLRDSLFYSACGNRIEPIVFFRKNIHSFVYCLDTKYNMHYDSEFPSIKTQLRQEHFRKRVNINLSIDFLKKNGWFQLEDEKVINKFRANWSIWEYRGDFFSLLFIACDSYTLWYHLYNLNQARPKVFFFQGNFDAWKGGLGENEGGEFIVNSDFFCDGFTIYKNPDFDK